MCLKTPKGSAWYWMANNDCKASTLVCVAASLEAAEKLAADGIDAKVINIHTIKPLDEELIVAAAKETGKVVTVEEHSIIGGLGGAVCECLSEKAPVPLLQSPNPSKYPQLLLNSNLQCQQYYRANKT